MSTVRLRLYVAGDTSRSHLAAANLRLLCDELQLDAGACEVVDVLQDPEAAEEARILTTPTLMRLHPLPPRRVTGDLSDHAAVLHGLSLPVDPLLQRSTA